MIVYDLVLATRSDKLTGVERFGINAFNASASDHDDVWAVATTNRHFPRADRVITVDGGLATWATLAKRLSIVPSAVICPSFPISPSMVLGKVPVARVLHDDFAWSRASEMSLRGQLVFRYYEQVVMRRNNVVFAPTETARSSLADVLSGVPISVCGNAPGLDVTTASTREVEALGDREFFLSVGTLEPRKNYERLLSLAAEAGRMGSTCLFVIAGRAGWGDIVEAIKTAPTNVIWLPFASDEELRWLYRRCRGYVALSHAEGFNMPLVEAGQAGCRIFYSDIPIHRDVAAPSATLIPQGVSDQDVVQMMLSSGAQPDAREVASYRDRFSWHAVSRALEAPFRVEGQ
jgi:glycosyltransferase involved in cell wall biosynthesis